MSFKFPSFKEIQQSLQSVDLENITKSIQNSNATKTVQGYGESFAHSIQPLTAKISEQLQQVQHASTHIGGSNVTASELPEEYLTLEKNCDLLLKLYTDLIHLTNDTYGKLSYDYPPGNTTLSTIKEANIGSMIGSKFNALRNASSPQELENLLMGKDVPKEDNKEIKTSVIPKTLFHQLSVITESESKELKESYSSVAEALELLSDSYKAIGEARIEQDDMIMKQLNEVLVSILDQQFIKVTELRKQVYHARQQFDILRADKLEDQEDSEELIAKEDELVNATEVAVMEMKKLLKPSKNVSLLKVLVQAQKTFFEFSAKKLASLENDLDSIKFDEEDEVEED